MNGSLFSIKLEEASLLSSYLGRLLRTQWYLLSRGLVTLADVPRKLSPVDLYLHKFGTIKRPSQHDAWLLD
jgi:hypothetical protein